ncbi:MAG TPA: histidine kinase dimerization/phospho-acceptor domain-containing protein, partial [Brumimicrobium sp.]|nr:histidine kinase dimerization/phospho-acceptor domain-containing protein [Brumimicrobium sp.]
MKRQTAIFFYLIAGYVVLQFAWWVYHLIDLTTKINSEALQKKQFLMIVGEGSVFFILLLLGLWRIRRSIQKEMLISKRQNNFLLSVTHELKTPLVTNKLYLQTLLKHKNLSQEKQEELLSQAIEENKRLEEIIESILTATYIENERLQLKYEKINFSEKLKEIGEDWAEKRMAIHFDIEPNIVLKVDLFIVKTVLHNLLENAYKYAGNEAKVVLYLRKEKKRVIWGVKDDGKGVDLANQNFIFKKFI